MGHRHPNHQFEKDGNAATGAPQLERSLYGGTWNAYVQNKICRRSHRTRSKRCRMASAIVHGEGLRTSPEVFGALEQSQPVELVMSGTAVTRSHKVIGRVLSRAYVLDRGVDELREQARKLGADGVINVRYERKFSADYFQDLFYIEGDAVRWQ